jgi:hypothetical protein
MRSTMARDPDFDMAGLLGLAAELSIGSALVAVKAGTP